jgi:glycosyltransferase involved in cell wall biosynthesis
MHKKINDVFFIGPKAPPVTGYANIVNSLNSCLNKKNINTTYLSTVPSFFSKLFPGLMWKLLRSLYLLLIIPLVIIMTPFHKIIYININGGIGLFFDLIITMFSRLMRKKIYLHHNSYSYLNKNNSLARHVFKAAGSNVIHVVNSTSMKKTLKSQYKEVSKVEVISNASILSLDKPDYFSFDVRCLEQRTDDKINFGFMGYMDEHKGIDLFCETISHLIGEGVSLNAIAVGPVHNEVFFNNIKEKFSDIVEFRGPVYGEDFAHFFQEVDILLFPSKYKNEAEPLTVYHALCAGVPVLSSQVGCLPNMMNEYNDSRSFDELSYKESTFSYIEANLEKIKNRENLRKSVSLEYQSVSNQKIKHLKSFILSLKMENTQ